LPLTQIPEDDVSTLVNGQHWVIRSLMFGVTPGDPLTFVTVSLILILISLLAAGLPVLRATKLDPLRTLRSE
jgi:ABC-type antimicrobial peptide transport system permease subunit